MIRRGLVASISDTTIWRWLSEDAIKPWTHRSWIFPRDPDFGPKAARVLDLYAGEWDGHPLKDDEFVISADEKTSIQARIRCHPTVAVNARQPMLVEHEYVRGGALQYLAAAGEAARQFLELRAGETLTDPTDLEMRGHCEAVVAFDDGLRPEMTMAELADHFDEIQRLAEAKADATVKGMRERVDEAVAPKGPPS